MLLDVVQGRGRSAPFLPVVREMDAQIALLRPSVVLGPLYILCGFDASSRPNWMQGHVGPWAVSDRERWNDWIMAFAATVSAHASIHVDTHTVGDRQGCG